MSPRTSRFHANYELLPRTSFESDDLPQLEQQASNSSWASRIAGVLPFGVKHISNPKTYTRYITPRRGKRSILRLIYFSLLLVPFVCLFLVLFVSILFPSYTHRPAHYEELRQRSLESSFPGRANTRDEKVFIAASLYEKDGELTSGAWAASVLGLVDLLGPQNVYLSIYENNPDAMTRQSLAEFERKLPCNSTIFTEDFDLNTLPRVALPNGETRIKRMSFLAEVRNRALTPIDKAGIAFDRLLYINDVNFDPIEAAQLLFSTNVDSTGRANYGAVCAVDFINPFKFYDRFATRDLDGYNMGIPFYPWFTSAGTQTSRKDVLRESDAVRVRGCWGGMTAFEAKWFQDQDSLNHLPSNPVAVAPPTSTNPTLTALRFRYEKDIFWDASECCLIHADLQYLRSGRGMPDDSGIYMNPFIRVAYSAKTLSWLSLSRRPERLYSLIHDILNRWVGLPSANPRQTEEPGQMYTDKVWEYDSPMQAWDGNVTEGERTGHYKDVRRTAAPGGFCGSRNLLVINENPKKGEGHWSKIAPPSPSRK